jgi:hypothetical protein
MINTLHLFFEKPFKALYLQVFINPEQTLNKGIMDNDDGEN